jgi:hypothetical protein
VTAAAGLPDGWQGVEDPALRWGRWRFYRAIDPAGASSVAEDNVPVRDEIGMPGEAGLRAFLADLDPLGAHGGAPAALPSDELLAAQVGHFLIRGSSRESSYVRVAAAGTTRTDDGGWSLAATYRRDGYDQHVTVAVAPGGDVAVTTG